jgi:hypothetical protein
MFYFSPSIHFFSILAKSCNSYKKRGIPHPFTPHCHPGVPIYRDEGYQGGEANSTLDVALPSFPTRLGIQLLVPHPPLSPFPAVRGKLKKEGLAPLLDTLQENHLPSLARACPELAEGRDKRENFPHPLFPN